MPKLLSVVVVASLLAACGPSEPVVVGESSEPVELSNDDERILYALGVVLADNIANLNLSPDEVALVTAGMRDTISGAEPLVDIETYGPRIQGFANQRIQAGVDEEQAASAAFADEIAAEPGAERTESGIVFVPMTEGDGDNPTASDTVTVHYHGTLRDGNVFDSSVDRGQPATFSLGGVIPCWTEGVQKIRVGGKAKLLCPADIAYGDAGRPGIPGGAALLFEVELLSIN
ncbi:MAG TPA: FKBP-type peptidyl-prolyl cis-trans isomerase [Gammaproteobacteria bacterium]|jgi:FKBP-type peptidyl-prolyl cis-trans isomerase FkpA